MPCGLSSDGLPISMQVTGKPYSEKTILQVGQLYQETTHWHTVRPGEIRASKDELAE